MCHEGSVKKKADPVVCMGCVYPCVLCLLVYRCVCRVPVLQYSVRLVGCFFVLLVVLGQREKGLLNVQLRYQSHGPGECRAVEPS